LSHHTHSAGRDAAGVGRQIVLPLSKSIEIAWKSIRIRMWRSLITTSGIILAIAFLASVWTGSSITTALQAVPEDDPNYPLVMRALQKQAIARESASIRVAILGREPDPSQPAGGTPAVLVRDALQERQEFSPYLVSSSPGGFAEALSPSTPADRPDAVLVTAFPESLAEGQTVAELVRFVEGGGALVVFGYEQLLPAGAEQLRRQLEQLLPGSPLAGRITVSGGQVKPVSHPVTADVEWESLPELSFLRVQPREGARALVRAGGEGLVWMARRGKGTIFWYPLAGNEVANPGALSWFLKGRLAVNCLRWGAREKLRGGTSASGRSTVSWCGCS